MHRFKRSNDSRLVGCQNVACGSGPSRGYFSPSLNLELNLSTPSGLEQDSCSEGKAGKRTSRLIICRTAKRPGAISLARLPSK